MDRYQKIKKIGEGSFGKAFLVKSKRDGQQYVIKEINIVRMSKKERDEARKEVALLAQMKHPNIVTYRESFEETGSLYICMDFCEAGDLYGKINSQRGILFHEDQVLDLFVQICFAIKYIHDRKILHRDIKSQNIFLTKNGTVKLGDFGIAKVLNSTVELARTCIGTPYYLSPEICENRPYNNKSDIWSLGCVLYEITTLKHAFEAGNMKNLVFKIVRGSYPPVSAKYSYELRNVIAALFKRNPRDRPSVNNLLKKNFLVKKVEKFMGNEVIAKELAHTVMHGQKMAKDVRALPPAPAPVSRPVSARSVQERRPESARPTPRYDPAAVYGAPVRKSKDNAARRSNSRDAPRKSSDVDRKRAAIAAVAASNNEIAKKRKELLEKEKARRLHQKENEFAVQHKAIVDKQKVARINKAREEGWKGLMESLSSNEDTKSSGESRPKTPQQPVKRNIPSPAFRPLPVGGAPQRMPVNDRGKYDHYNEFLDKLAAERGDRQRDAAPKDYMNAGEGPQIAARQGHHDQQLGAKAAEQARVVEEYMNRKKEAAYYKQRGQAQVRGVQRRPDSARGGAGDARPVKREWAEIDAKNEEEKEYLARLKQIRLQNFNERRNMRQEGVAKQGAGVKGALNADAEQRKKKIEALKAQADERANKLKVQLEQKRREAYEKEKYARERDRGFEQKPLFPVEPPRKGEAAPAISITQAMSAIGAKPQVESSSEKVEPAPVIPITQAMAAIGARKEVESSIEKSPLQKKKDAILRRVNEKPRPKWGNRDEGLFLANMELEETASGMEATSVRDSVVLGGDSKPKEERKRWGAPEELKNKEEVDPDVLPSARRQWGGMHESLINKLSEADIQATVTLVKKEEESPGKPRVGETIVITTQPPTPKAHGTITLSKDDTKSKQPSPSPEKPSSKLKESLKKESPGKVDVKGPTEVNASQGGKLFDKVELEEADDQNVDDMKVEEFEEEETNPSYQKTISGMKLGLTIGHFDLQNSKMLRTCSLPDLSKLFKTIEGSPDDVAHVRYSLDLPSSPKSQGDEDGNEDGDEEEGDKDREEEGSDSDSDVDSDEVDEDLANVMATMESLLLDRQDSQVEHDIEELNDLKGSGSDSGNEADNDRDSATTTGDSSIINTIVPGQEEWCNSDDDDDDNNSDREREEEDMFCRLEAARAKLESELGCDRFLDVYKAVQAAHEDEDETIENGEKIALKILGDKGHLYNKILQLVMADGAYIEDND
ncbi:serine/threonine-protein kinase Nek1-like isoform X3 [Lineus longissimus]|uniref:serine/threonine-protein kinase Nek1-like isoform X3 n=1 Tax=Lineus longissimus TaxID=88925 RepID=UPI002B4E024F